MKFTKKSIYIGLFGILYLIVAFSSFFHAVSFFGLANNSWMSVILAFAFEVGQAAVLFSLLTSQKDRSRVMPWVLMTMFTLVQVIGNVYSSYKYIITNSVENLRFFKEPIFIWTDLPDAQANVIIVYLVGALLPIAALLLTSMITNYLSDSDNEKESDIIDNKYDELKKDIDKLKKDNIWSMEEDNIDEENEQDGPPEGEGRSDEQEIKDLNTLVDNKEQEIEQLKQELEEKNKQLENVQESQELNNKEIKQETETKLENFDKVKYDSVDEALGHEHDGEGLEELKNVKSFKEIQEEKEKKQSHFINL